jgi:drug/metabolite transporter (DMT)-like permease
LINDPHHGTPTPPTWKLLLAFAAVYIIWGSTYLAIKHANESLPPFAMASVRFLISGAIILAWHAHTSGRFLEGVSRAHWRSAAIVGGLLLLGGNGGVVWAESGNRVPSGLAALLVATLPLWMVLIEWLRRGGSRPTGRVMFGVLLGFAGVGLLMSEGLVDATEGVDPLGAIVLMMASLSWGIGSVYSRHTPLPKSPLVSTGLQMICGGALLGLAGWLAGDWQRLDLAAVTTKSWLAWGYLIVFGSLIGFTAYIWLLRVTTPARASTYAYVNPVVALFIGWAVDGERLTAMTFIAAPVILAAIAFITATRARRMPAPAPAARAEEALVPVGAVDDRPAEVREAT